MFAKHYKEEFLQYYYESNLNETNSNGYKLLFPSKFEDKIKHIDNTNHKTTRTSNATEARWKNYVKSDYKYNTHHIRHPSLPLQHNLRNGKKQLVPLDGFCIVDFKYIDKFYEILSELNELLNSNKSNMLFDQMYLFQTQTEGI